MGKGSLVMNIPVFRSAYLISESMFWSVDSLECSEHLPTYIVDLSFTNCDGVTLHERYAYYSFSAFYFVMFSKF